ncbi:hypothetical protein QTP88_000758 [Uroleucon formosanum]
METETLSDHFYMYFTIDQSPKNTYKVSRTSSSPNRDNPGALASLLEKACDECMPKGIYKGNKKPSYWWNNEIIALRRQCVKARKALKRRTKRGITNQNEPKLAEYTNTKKNT